MAWRPTPAGGQDRSIVWKYVGPVLVAHGFDHLDAHDGVVLALDRAVVLELRRRRGRSYPASATRSRASSCCSLERVTESTVAPRWAARTASAPQPVPISSTRVPCPTPALSSRRSIFGLLRGGQAVPGDGLQRLAGSRKDRAGVGHGLVEEQGEELVREVVVPGDVGAGVLLGVAFLPRLARQVERAEFLQRFGHQRPDPGSEDFHDGGEVVGVPVPGHERLAQADQSAVTEPGRERLGTVQGHHRVGLPGRGRLAQDGAVRVADLQRQVADRGLKDGLGHRPATATFRPAGTAAMLGQMPASTTAGGCGTV